jgi:hypothetical protein
MVQCKERLRGDISENSHANLSIPERRRRSLKDAVADN